MVIDFHTHTFPDKIADRTIEMLAAKADIPAYRGGTVASLIESMNRSGVDYSVVLPVATAPKQLTSINRTSVELNGKNNLIFFGGIHPDTENPAEVLEELKSQGIKGIKLHPDYQECFFDDDRMINIMYEAAKRDMIIVTHAGLDRGYPDLTHCTPDRVLNVLYELRGIIDYKLVLAHMGGFNYPDETLRKLVGKPVYMDTAYSIQEYPAKCKEIIEKHGVDHILFATDSPWKDQHRFIEIIHEMGFSAEDEEKIFSGNAIRLLGGLD